MATELENLRTELTALKRQVTQLRNRGREADQFIDCVTSPLWKRLVWWVQGFYFRKVGRWYGRDWSMRGVWPDKS